MDSIPVSGSPTFRALKRWSIYLIFCVMAIALAVLAGWQWDIPFLRRPIPGLLAMNPTTAVAFILSSFSALLVTLPQRYGYQRIAGKLLAIFVLAVGTGCLLGYIVPSLAGADQWLYADRLRVEGTGNGSARMAVNSTLCFLLIGSALLDRRRHLLADAAALLIAILALLSLTGYLYGVNEFYGASRHFPMAIHSAGCFLLLALSLLFATPDLGIMKVFTSPLAGSIAARRLLPFAFGVPIGLGLLRMYGYWHGYLTTELGVTLLVTSIITCFIFVIGYNAVLLNRRDEQRLQAEAELGNSESRWRGLVSSVKDYAIFQVDPAGNVLSWNEGAQWIKGYRPEEIIGRPISVFYTPEEIAADEPAHNLQMAAAAGTHYSEGWRIRKDGSRFWAEAVFTAIYNDDNTVQSYVKITRDTTEQKLAREKIDYLARLIEDTSDAIFSTGSDGAIKTWNRSSELLFGYTAEEVIGREATELMRPQLTEDVREPIRRQLQEQGSWKGEIMYLDRKGVQRTILQSVSNVREADGQFGGYVIVGRDVTRWKEVEERLRQFNTNLEAQVKEKTAEIRQSNADLRALASHLQDIREEERAAMAREVHDELGQQLTGLKMDLAMIQRKGPLADTAWLAAKTQSTMELLDTTIRTVRKIASELRPSILDDLGLVSALDWQGQEFMKRSGIDTHFDTDGSIPDLLPGVSIGMFRICQESLTNVARHAGAKHVSITLRSVDQRLTLTIRDDGRGIDLGIPDRNGKTLGLLGMKERALMMGGVLTIDSKPGEGLSLSVAVPLSNNSKP